MYVLRGHESRINALEVTPDGRRLISASSDQTMRVWDLFRGLQLASITLEASVECIAAAPDGVTILGGDLAGNVYCMRYLEHD